MMNMGLKIIIIRDRVNNSMKKSLTLMIYSGCSLEVDFSKIDKEGLYIEEQANNIINNKEDMLIKKRGEDKFLKILD